MTIELESTLAQAEVLFLSFSQLVSDMDRRRAELDSESAASDAGLRHRKDTAPNAAKTVQMTSFPELSLELRELLKNNR
jgi:TBC1 domain family member 15